MNICFLILIFMLRKSFDNEKHRHVYNANDFLNVENIKNRLTQCFFHIYRQHIYEFLIVDVIKSIFMNINEMRQYKFQLDFMLVFFVYKLIDRQAIYEFSFVNDDILYLISTLKKFD